MSEYLSITGADLGSAERLAEHDKLSTQMRRESGLPPILTREHLFALIGRTYTNAGLLQMEAAGRFPRRLAMFAHHTVWASTEIFSWLADGILCRDAQALKRIERARPAYSTRQKPAEAAPQ